MVADAARSLQSRVRMKRNKMAFAGACGALGVALGVACAPEEGAEVIATSSPGAALAVPASDVFDFLIQDVCVVNGVVTALDPRTYPGTTRNLRMDETLPYRKITDHVPNLPAGQIEI